MKTILIKTEVRISFLGSLSKETILSFCGALNRLSTKLIINSILAESPIFETESKMFSDGNSLRHSKVISSILPKESITLPIRDSHFLMPGVWNVFISFIDA